MPYVIVILIVIIFIVAIVLVIREKAASQKQVFKLMQLNGTPLITNKQNIPEMNRLLNILLPLLEVYVNGPDQSMRARHESTPQHYVITQDGFLADVWIQTNYVRSQNELFVVEVSGNTLKHIVRDEDYIRNSGSFEGLANHVFTNTDPA